MNLRICDLCRKDPRQSDGDASVGVNVRTVDGYEIDICVPCAEKPFNEVVQFAREGGRKQSTVDSLTAFGQIKRAVEVGRGQRYPLGIPGDVNRDDWAVRLQ